MLDELKRVTAERDKFKEETVKAEKSTKEAWDEVASLRKQNDADGVINDPQENPAEPYTTQDNSLSQGDGDVQPTVLRSPSTSTKSRTGSLASMSMFSPRLKQVESPIVHEESEDFFSYDKELPRLETELHERETIIKVLQAEVKTLKGDLAVARESTQSMVETLEESSRELHALRERKDRTDTELRDKQVSFENRIDQLKVDLATSEEKIHKWEIDHVRCDPSVIMRLEERLKETQSALDNLRAQGNMDSKDANEFQKVSPMISNKEREATEASSSQAEDRYNEKKLNTLNNLVRSLRTQLLEAEEERINLTSKIASEEKSSEALRDQVMQLESKISGERQAELASTNDDTTESKSSNVLSSTASEPVNVIDASAASKKKNKKKRKGVKPAALNDKEVLVDGEKVKSHDTTGISLTLGEESSLREEINRLHVLLEEKEANIEKINDKLKQQDDLREEIETLRDDLIHVGQEHVEAKDKVKSLLAEKCVLETTIQDLEGRVTDLHKIHTSSAAGSEQKQKDLVEQFEDLKLKATNLQNDLVAAQQLASSRYKELTDMRVILQKAQPELIALRSEATESKTFKEALTRKEAELKRLDSKHEEIRIEIVRLKQIISERDSEIKSLNQKLSQEAISRLKMEDMNSKTNQEIQRLETERRQASESIDKLSKDLSKSRGDLAASRTTMEDLDQQNFRIKRDSESLKEEIDLKTAQHASAQSLLGSMRDQITELAMQVKEARDRCESLDEEAAEARRLLGERSREGETMRRLLADAEGRTDAKIREMKERMDIAIEERDRAEDEASTAARRKARELEDMRNKIREAERGLKRAEEENEELESAQREWRRRREELEQKSGNYVKEVDDVRKAMGELRDALDESERQARELEKQKAEMRRSVEDTQHRLEKLQKSNKVRIISQA